MSHDIFMSYGREDQARMLDVRDALQKSGLTVWTDTGIKPGTESWKAAIATAIKGCKAVVVLFSPDSAQSTWVNRELDYAELHNKKIYPLLVRGNEAESVPFGYTTYQFVDIRDEGQVDEGIITLLTAMQGSLLATSNVPAVNAETVRAHGGVPIPAEAPPTDVPDEDDPDSPKEVLWRWIEQPGLSMTVPATWKVLEPSEQNIRKMQFLMAGRDDGIFYRVIEDNVQMGYMLTRIKGMGFKHRMLLSDIAGMTPIGMFVTDLFPPANIRLMQRMMPLLLPILRRRIESFWQDRYNAEITAFESQQTNDGLLIRVVGGTKTVGAGEIELRGQSSLLIPGGPHPWTITLLSTEVSRFVTETDVYDRMARSIRVEV